jgi:thiamine-monophosphate kinase
MPRSFGAREVRRLARGMSALARRSRIALVGGNFTSARDLSITITAAGDAPKPLLRSGGRPGDLLYVSGTLGDARAGLHPRAPAAAKRRQRRPEPRLRLGLLASRFASAAIDLSDGLAQDLRHVCDASRVGAEVHTDLLPRAHADEATALAGGEDYELLLAVPPARRAAFERACAAAREKVTRIGQLGGTRLRFLRGTHPIPPPPGFDHFRAGVHSKAAPARTPTRQARPRI